MEIRYACHPDDVKYYTTEELRKNFLVDDLFKAGEMKLVYSHVDRIIFGSAVPTNDALVLEAGKELGVEFFLQRREMGIINIGAPGKVILDGKAYELGKRYGMYVGMGIKDVKFESVDPSNPAKFYINSAPAHQTYPTVVITPEMASPTMVGSDAECNKRTINKYLNPAVCKTCQLQMGLTELAEGSVWNTMPCHTHDRRMEVYFYFDMEPSTRVFHLMGEPDETRHIVMANEQAVISPSWSIHSGCATKSYTFIWGMVGENQTYDDMDVIKMDDLK
ncbi:MAG: 5-dehydro-4-deoxy-D-glucuronate isomerase [Clostridia bacterium]|nr:5-dehydro-4-deoxy-D-glucuronate isomerase [Clostridia bacterium]